MLLLLWPQNYIAQGLEELSASFLIFVCLFQFLSLHIGVIILTVFCFCSSFVARIFNHALEDSYSKSALVHSLSVCISLLDPRRSIPSPLMYSFRNQHVYESAIHVNPETVGAMLPKLGRFVYVLHNYKFVEQSDIQVGVCEKFCPPLMHIDGPIK